MNVMKSTLLVALVLGGLVTFAKMPFAHAADKAEKRTGPIGVIDSLDPCGTASGAPKQVTFTAKCTFAGVNGEKHTITCLLKVVDENCKEIGSAKLEQVVTSGEEGCIKCPVSFTSKDKLAAGVYFLHATLTNAGPKGTVTADARACSLILTQ